VIEVELICRTADYTFRRLFSNRKLHRRGYHSATLNVLRRAQSPEGSLFCSGAYPRVQGRHRDNLFQPSNPRPVKDSLGNGSAERREESRERFRSGLSLATDPGQRKHRQITSWGL
jgi:hypothetical protein